MILESWQRSRAEYLDRLAEPETVEAYWFVYHYTDDSDPPDPTIEEVIEEISDKPELLTDQRYRSARYWGDCGQRKTVFYFDELVRLITMDLVEEEALEHVGL